VRSSIFIGVATVAAVLALALNGARAGDAGSAPPVFSDLSYEKALEASREQQKVLLVKATAEWCGPCKRMDRTTWRDEKVVAWVKENAIAIQVDVDEEPELSRRLRVRAMPTTIGYRAGEEVDRAVGYIDGAAMLSFAQAVSRGEQSARARAGVPEKFVEPQPGERPDIDGIMETARELAHAGKHAEAADAYVWLWRNMLRHSPAMVGVRASFMAGEMSRLAAVSDDARTKFAALRDEAEEKLKIMPVTPRRWMGPDYRRDWIVLNEILGDEDRTLAWFDEAKSTIGTPKQHSGLDDHRVKDLLIQNDRWSDLGLLHPNPIQELNSAQQMRTMTSRFANEEHAQEMREYQDRSSRDTAGMLYAVMLTYGRDEEAGKVGARALKLMDSGAMRVALVTWALNAGQPRASHRVWLEEASAAGEATQGVLQRLDAALGK